MEANQTQAVEAGKAKSDIEISDICQIPFIAMWRVGQIFREGKRKYGAGNSDPRLQYPTTLSSNKSNSLGQNRGRLSTTLRLRAFALPWGSSVGGPGQDPDGRAA